MLLDFLIGYLMFCFIFYLDRVFDINRVCFIYFRVLCFVLLYFKGVIYYYRWLYRVERIGEVDVFCYLQLVFFGCKRKLFDILWIIFQLFDDILRRIKSIFYKNDILTILFFLIFTFYLRSIYYFKRGLVSKGVQGIRFMVVFLFLYID